MLLRSLGGADGLGWVDAEGAEHLLAQLRDLGGAPGCGPYDGPRPATRVRCALVEDEHPVGQRERLVDVVGDEQDRRLVALPELGDEGVHLDPGQRVQRAERLVEQQQVGLADQGAGQRHALRLPAGQRAAARRRPSRSG